MVSIFVGGKIREEKKTKIAAKIKRRKALYWKQFCKTDFTTESVSEWIPYRVIKTTTTLSLSQSQSHTIKREREEEEESESEEIHWIWILLLLLLHTYSHQLHLLHSFITFWTTTSIFSPFSISMATTSSSLYTWLEPSCMSVTCEADRIRTSFHSRRTHNNTLFRSNFNTKQKPSIHSGNLNFTFFIIFSYSSLN